MDFVKKKGLKQSCDVRNIRFRNGPKHSPCLDYGAKGKKHGQFATHV